MTIRALVGVTTVVFGATLAHAQPGDPSEPPPGPPPSGPPPTIAPAPPMQPQPPPAQPESTIDKGVREDANASRGWLVPTALTEPGGTWSISDYELFLVSIGYAATDQLSLSATTIPPLTKDFPLWLLLSAKYQVLKAGRVRVAAQAAFTYFSIKNSGSNTSDSFSAADLGGALTLCLDDDCHSHLSGFLGAGFARDQNNAVPFVAAGTIVARIGRHVKLVGEVDSAFIAGRVNDVANGAMFWYGVRFTSSMIGVDLGFMRPIGVSNDTGLILGFPILTFSYRNID